MLHIADIRQNKNSIINKLLIKNFNAENLINTVIEEDELRKLNQQRADDILAMSNKIAKEISVLYKIGKVDKVNLLKEKSLLLKKESKELSSFRVLLEKEIKDILIQIPNSPYHTVKQGTSDKNNEILISIELYGLLPFVYPLKQCLVKSSLFIGFDITYLLSSIFE